MSSLIPNQAVLSESEFESVLRALIFSAQLAATGNLSWRTTHQHQEAITRGLKVADSLPRGTDRLPLDDFFVLQVSDGELNPERVIEQIAPRRSQTLVVLLLDRRDHSRWAGAVYRDGDVSPLAGFRIVGGEMIKVGLADDEPRLDDPRYTRLAGAIGATVLRKLTRSQVTLVGASRSGTLLAWHLTALGIPHLRLVDPDGLEPHNFDVMIGLDADTLHATKVLAVAEAVLRYRPDMRVTCCQHAVAAPAARAVFDQPTDLLVTCTDNVSSRVAVTIQAQRLLVPHLDIGTAVQRDADGTRRIFGDARLFLPPHQGCCFCTPPLSDEEREQTLYELSAPGDTLQRGEPVEWFKQRGGSLITITSLTVAAGVQMWLDLLAGDLRTSCWQRLDWAPGRGLEVQSAAIGAADDCPCCGPAS